MDPARELRNADRAERVLELRRQLLDHDKDWRETLIEQSPTVHSIPGLPASVLSPAMSPAPSGSSGPLSPTLTSPTTSADTLPAAASIASPVSSGSGRLTGRERNLLRQQLREVPRLQLPRRD